MRIKRWAIWLGVWSIRPNKSHGVEAGKFPHEREVCSWENHGVFQSHGATQNGWFLQGKSHKNGWFFLGYPYFRKPSHKWLWIEGFQPATFDYRRDPEGNFTLFILFPLLKWLRNDTRRQLRPATMIWTATNVSNEYNHQGIKQPEVWKRHTSANVCHFFGFPAHKGPPHCGLGENHPGHCLELNWGDEHP